MTKKEYVLIFTSLLISLFIYLFYRTERTVINELFIWLITPSVFTNLKAAVVHNLPLNNIAIYSLPEGLWIFCITLTSKSFYISLKRLRIDGVYIPLIFCFSLEILQLIHVTNGRFDFSDIWVSILFWLVARNYFTGNAQKNHITSKVNLKSLVCLVSYSIVYLAHVTT